ncbi:hypothetical protein AVEN_157163-1 [Araneus ventricosus]|uniref:Uncharacterized protein n=1 Tax=Araneus ventricosus TaxID=182803 RepID=A0A4Y2KNJ5_ARAVE|nr:hypothetical protein AVEN_157163-1 [Araneus ventricosus]
MDLVCTRQAYGSSSMELGLEPFGPEAGRPMFNLSQHNSRRAYGSEWISCAPDTLMAFLRWNWVSNHLAARPAPRLETTKLPHLRKTIQLIVTVIVG